MSDENEGITSFKVLSTAMKNGCKALVEIALASEAGTQEQKNATIAASVLMAWIQKIDDSESARDNLNQNGV